MPPFTQGLQLRGAADRHNLTSLPNGLSEMINLRSMTVTRAFTRPPLAGLADLSVITSPTTGSQTCLFLRCEA